MCGSLSLLGSPRIRLQLLVSLLRCNIQVLADDISRSELCHELAFAASPESRFSERSISSLRHLLSNPTRRISGEGNRSNSILTRRSHSLRPLSWSTRHAPLHQSSRSRIIVFEHSIERKNRANYRRAGEDDLHVARTKDESTIRTLFCARDGERNDEGNDHWTDGDQYRSRRSSAFVRLEDIDFKRDGRQQYSFTFRSTNARKLTNERRRNRLASFSFVPFSRSASSTHHSANGEGTRD